VTSVTWALNLFESCFDPNVFMALCESQVGRQMPSPVPPVPFIDLRTGDPLAHTPSSEKTMRIETNMARAILDQHKADRFEILWRWTLCGCHPSQNETHHIIASFVPTNKPYNIPTLIPGRLVVNTLPISIPDGPTVAPSPTPAPLQWHMSTGVVRSAFNMLTTNYEVPATLILPLLQIHPLQVRGSDPATGTYISLSVLATSQSKAAPFLQLLEYSYHVHVELSYPDHSYLLHHSHPALRLFHAAKRCCPALQQVLRHNLYIPIESQVASRNHILDVPLDHWDHWIPRDIAGVSRRLISIGNGAHPM
tara:strand:- start:9570 stop:10493 length:924 start_codon:yes stop_codon:yes gene_type:complete